eukprot:3749675-Amphidinium_carterae.1
MKKHANYALTDLLHIMYMIYASVQFAQGSQREPDESVTNVMQPFVVNDKCDEERPALHRHAQWTSGALLERTSFSVDVMAYTAAPTSAAGGQLS